MNVVPWYSQRSFYTGSKSAALLTLTIAMKISVDKEWISESRSCSDK